MSQENSSPRVVAAIPARPSSSSSSTTSSNTQFERWDRFSSWIHGLCIVTFDLELGQAIECVYPTDLKLSENDKSNICYLAFPDSNSGVMGDTQFHFRIRTTTTTSTMTTDNVFPTLRADKALEDYNRKCPVTIQYDPNYLFGFVYFRQTRDSSIRRGYYQKSFILLTRLPLVSLFNHLTNVAARRFFDSGETSLEIACHDADTWPFPDPGSNLQLPFFGHVFTVFIPSISTRSVESGSETVTVSASSPDSGLPVFSEPDIFSCLLPIIEHIDTLWELVLTAEPLVIMAGTPTLTSSTVQYLTTIIHPLSFCADYRPFYTIHDSDFKDITGSNCNALPNILLGVTNPFFSKALSHWPHIVKLGDGSRDASSLTSSSSSSFVSGNGISSPRHHKQSVKKMSKFKLDSKPGVYSQSKALLEKDKNVIKGIIKGIQLKRPADVQSALIRRHFLELTQTFMIPLERYITSLMPLAKNISPYRAAPKVKPFNPDDFFRSLENCGPQLTSTVKGDWEGLYRRFFKSPNFVGWYNTRSREVSKKLELLHLQSLSESRIEHWVRGKEEVQLVDMVLRIRNKLADKGLALPDIVTQKLTEHVDTILGTLPTDLKSVLEVKQ